MPAPPLPDLGPNVPMRGGAIRRAIGRTVLKLAGWDFEGALPDLPKFVIAVVPHTSNWDFVVGVFARQAIGLRAHFLGKHTLFRPPFGWLFRWLGGTPVRRDVRAGVVEQVAATFARHEQFVLALAPEGTRRRVEAWRTGFYHIAREAGVPIALVAFDYGRKRVVVGPPTVPTGDTEGDLRAMRAFFDGIVPRNPEGVG